MGHGESLGLCRVGGQVRVTVLKITVHTEQTIGGERESLPLGGDLLIQL